MKQELKSARVAAAKARRLANEAHEANITAMKQGKKGNSAKELKLLFAQHAAEQRVIALIALKGF